MVLIQGLIQNFPKKKLSLLIIGLTFCLFFLIYIVSEVYDIPMRLIIEDPLSTFGVNPLTGIVSNLGVLLWCATASILFFTFFLVIGSADNKKTMFLLYCAILTTILLFDDLFMFHEHILKSIGIEESVMYGVYMLLFGILFVAFFRILKNSTFNYLILITFISFGSSVIIDFFTGEKLRMLFEDGFKFLGIVCWSMFFIFYSFKMVRHSLSEK